MAECARGGVEKRGEELLGAIIGENDAKLIGVARVGIFLVVRRIDGSELEEQIPRGVFREKFFGGEIVAGKFGDDPLRAAAALEENSRGFRRIKGAGRIVIGKRREEGGEFGGISGEGIPSVTVTVVDDGARVEDLLDAVGLFTDDADDHVEEFGETEDLPDDGMHADVAGDFVGVA